MSWLDEAACRNHEHPEWWFPDQADRALDAKAVCLGVDAGECPVRRRCAQDAYDRGERFAVQGGFRCSDPAEFAALCRYLGVDPPAGPGSAGQPNSDAKDEGADNRCSQCGSLFRTCQSWLLLCPACRGFVPIGTVRAHVRALRAAGWHIGQISDESGVPRSTVQRIGDVHHKRRNVGGDIAQRLLSIRVDTPAVAS